MKALSFTLPLLGFVAVAAAQPAHGGDPGISASDGAVMVAATTGTTTGISVGNWIATATVDPTVIALPAVSPAPTSGETTILLDVMSGIRAVPAARVTVPVGERLRINAPVNVTVASAAGGVSTGTAGNTGTVASSVTVAWMKDGRPIPGATSSVLTLDSVQSSDAGTYTCLQAGVGVNPLPVQALILGVGPTSRLLNISTRGALAAGAGQSFITGFVVAGPGTSAKKMLVRAIGPTLKRFGIENPVARPVLRIYDSAGQPYTNAYVYPAVVGGPTYESDLANALASVGAFPTDPGSGDVVLLVPFVPGAYTAQVTSADASGGEVLIEIYEVP
jgi:hypothetical protein